MITSVMAYMIFAVLSQPMMASEKDFTKTPIESAYSESYQRKSTYLYRTDTYRYDPVTGRSARIRKGSYKIYTPDLHTVDTPDIYYYLNKQEPQYELPYQEVLSDKFDY